MALNEKKITSYTDNVKNLSDYPSDDGITAAQLKAIFDGRTDKEVKSAINGIIDELTATTGAAQLGTKDGSSVQTALDSKVNAQAGKGLSTNDYTTAEKQKLSGIAAGAQVNTVTSVAGKTGAVALTLSDVADTVTKKSMTADERAKLSGIAEGATKTIVDAALSATSTNPVQNKAVKAALDAKANKNAPIIQNKLYVQTGTTDGTTPAALHMSIFPASDGACIRYGEGNIMTPTLKITENGLFFNQDGDDYKVYAENNKPPVDTALSSTSTNPVQNKVVNAAINDLGIKYGTYTGNGSEYKTITLSRKPNWVFVLQKGCRAAEYNNNQEIYYGGLALQSAPVMAGSEKVLEITSTGFTVYNAGAASASVQVKANENQQTYTYLWG